MTLSKEYNTKSRKYILEFLKQNSDTTVSVMDILSFLEQSGISVNTTTVYRYLNKLNDEKKVIKLNDKSGQKAVYQLIGHKSDCGEHIHIQCTFCGKLEHIECELMELMRSHLKEEHGFEIRCDGSTLYGICKDCKNKI